MRKVYITLLIASVLLLSCDYINKLIGGGDNSKTNQPATVKQAIKIGDQTWISVNLSTSAFKNGDTIPQAKTDEEWKSAGEAGKPAWCYYNNDPKSGKKYGKLYNWFAVSDQRGLAPAGWHIADDTEWGALVDYLGGEAAAAPKMKSAGKTDTTACGFAGLPGGYRNDDGSFGSIDSTGAWWTTSEGETRGAWCRSLPGDYSNVNHCLFYKKMGLSVRCIKD